MQTLILGQLSFIRNRSAYNLLLLIVGKVIMDDGVVIW